MARIAKSPYEIQRFIEQTPAFDWAPLWKALGIPDGEGPGSARCEARVDGLRDCGAELMYVPDPEQAILLLRDTDSDIELYLRFVRDPQGQENGWRFNGFYHPFVKYFKPEHEIRQVGDSPFLVVAGQGAAGTGLSSKIQDWIDLTRDEMKPLFSLTVEGHHSYSGEPVWEVHGSVVQFTLLPIPKIMVSWVVEFSSSIDFSATVPLGMRHDEVTFLWKQGQGFVEDESRSTLPAKDVERLYQDVENELQPAEFLRYDLAGLKEIASGRENYARNWLDDYLAGCPDTAEKRELEKILKAAAKN